MSEIITTAGLPGHPPCPHGRCRQCDGCRDCDQAGAGRARDAVTRRLIDAGDDIEQALASADSAHVAFTELTRGHLFDMDLAETGAGDDAVERLAQIMADLRDVARIIENRQLREQLAITSEAPR
jgi:hypothetical protein